MDFLPHPLDGLGFAANVTLLDPTPPSVMMADGTRRQLSNLTESANVVGNVRAFYTIGPVTVAGRVEPPVAAAPHHLDHRPTQDIRYKASDLFDAQIRVRLSRALTIIAQGKEPVQQPPRPGNRPGFGWLSEELVNGRAYYVGALVRF